ncbi:MAG: TonB family protein [bacterium]|nr:TonB family protein [bacterium]
MNFSQSNPHYLSANAIFKNQYRKVLRWSLLVALLLTAVGVYISPQYSPNPYVLRTDYLEISDVEVIDDLVLPEIKPAKPPVIPRNVEPVSELMNETEYFPNTIDVYFPQYQEPPVSNNPFESFTSTSQKPSLLHFAKPDYPEIARRAQLEGTVIVKVLVGVDGRVKKTAIIQSAHPLLDKAAAFAASKCKFKPGTQRSIPVKAWMAIPYTFKLN